MRERSRELLGWCERRLTGAALKETFESDRDNTMQRFVLVFLAVAFSTVGCGPGNPLQIVPVSGTITFDGQPCPAAGRVGFTPLESAPGLPRRPGAGPFDVDGKFQVTSFEEGDGLVPGRYSVRVRCYSGPITDMTSDDMLADLSYVAEGYKAEEVTIEPGDDPVVLNLDVPLKK